MSNNITATHIQTITVSNLLGEGVQWNKANQTIWWTDIEKSCLYCYCLPTSELKMHPMPERVGCFAFIKKQERLLIAFASGIAFYDLRTGDIDWLVQPEAFLKGNRFNDGRVDRQGRFYAGTMVEHEHESQQSGSLYRLDEKLKCTKVISDISISNGLCWSPDGKIMYHADSAKNTIYKYDYCTDSGNISNPQVFAQTSEHIFPDGSSVDSDGGVWNAQWGGGRVVRYNPRGELDFILHMPISQPSCVCFAGDNLDLLVVTSAKQNLSTKQRKTELEAGHVFIYKITHAKGLIESQFTGYQQQ